MSFTNYRKHRRSTIMSGANHYTSGMSHWREVQETALHASNRRYSQHAIRSDLEWLRRKEAGIIASGVSTAGRVFYARSSG